MFEKGQKYIIVKRCETPDHKGIMRKIKAEVAYAPKHKRFVSFRFHFVNLYGERTSYTESVMMDELVQMAGCGWLKKQ